MSLRGFYVVLASSVIPPSPLRPPLMQRLGFGAIFAGAGYVVSTGDVYNGTGISTGMYWALSESYIVCWLGLQRYKLGPSFTSSWIFENHYALHWMVCHLHSLAPLCSRQHSTERSIFCFKKKTNPSTWLVLLTCNYFPIPLLCLCRLPQYGRTSSSSCIKPPILHHSHKRETNWTKCLPDTKRSYPLWIVSTKAEVGVESCRLECKLPSHQAQVCHQVEAIQPLIFCMRGLYVCLDIVSYHTFGPVMDSR